ncbi:MAG TPA: nitroreductase [Mycobacterium sp.]|jgi:nitroreductase|nr:nitroreductase [Mycobacterium sp.]
MYDLEKTIKQRRSIRMFLPDRPVPRELIDESLALAIRAPSNSNIQPWHLALASGPARDRVVAAMLHEATTKPPHIRPLPPAFDHFRRDVGGIVYPAMGIRRDDPEGRRIAVLRNWEFFRAPIGGVVSVHQDLDYVDSLGVGMFLQTFVLALTARGIGTCVQVAIAGYPEICREHLNIPDEYRILCGLSIGYADPDFPANHLDIPRNPVSDNVVFIDS